jgi:hypothetical protein
MPSIIISELMKVSAHPAPKVVLTIMDLSFPLGHQVATKVIDAL